MVENIDVDESLVQRFPTPLAKLVRRACNAKTPLDRHQAAFYLWEAAIKLLGSVAVVEYAALGDHDPKLVEMLENLARPAFGHWWEFVRRLVPVLADSGDERFCKVRDLVLGPTRDDLPRAAGLDVALVENQKGKAPARSTVCLTELFDRLVRYRNHELGHGAAGQRPGRFYDRMARALLAGGAEVLGPLDVLAGRRLIDVGEVRRQASGDWLVERYELVGETPRRIESLEVAEGGKPRLPRPERVYVERIARSRQTGARNGCCRLHPLLHFELESERVFFLNARRGKRQAEYLCYHDGEQLRRDLDAEHRELLARVLRMEVDADDFEAWAAHSQAEEPAVGDTIAPEPIDRTIGEFELLSRLGQGGMGVVYRAWQPSLGRQVALKCMLQQRRPQGRGPVRPRDPRAGPGRAPERGQGLHLGLRGRPVVLRDGAGRGGRPGPAFASSSAGRKATEVGRRDLARGADDGLRRGADEREPLSGSERAGERRPGADSDRSIAGRGRSRRPLPAAAGYVARSWKSSARWPRPRMRCTRRGSSIATSSPATSWSTPDGEARRC